jgi:hypothetical protein
MLKHCVDRSRRCPIAAIAGMADVSSKLLYLIVQGRRRLTEPVRIRLSAVLTGIEDGTVTLHRVGQTWTVNYRQPCNGRASSLYPIPAPPLPPQDRIVPARDFIDGARCRSCGGWRYTRVTLHGAPAEYFLCDGCLWWETAGMGARPVQVRRSPSAFQKTPMNTA